jgi:hypothetical protein
LLADGRCASRRRAFLAIVPADDIPPLPDLCRLWAADPRPDDPAHNVGLERDLAAAEEQLSAYRAALHRRLGDATAELIARYAEDPMLALAALPATAAAPRARPRPRAPRGKPSPGV